MSFSCLTFSASACPRPPWPIRMQMPAASGLPCLQSTQAEEAGVHRLPSLLPAFCCSLPPRLLPASLPCGFRLFLSLFPSMLSGMLLITCVTPSCPFCCCSLPFSLAPCVATLHARALNAGETQAEFKCTSFFLSWHLSPFSLSVSPLLFFIYILYLSVCPCCLLSLCCPLLRRRARAHAISFAASVHLLTIKFKRNELKLSSILKSVGGTLRRTIQSHSDMDF